jgi:hypothetical protein
VRALNHEGFTPMHKACRGDHIEVMFLAVAQ